LEITQKKIAKKESNSQIINFENNSFKKDSIGFSVTLKDPSATQSNLNSISTKTNTKSQQEITGRLTYENQFKVSNNSNQWKK